MRNSGGAFRFVTVCIACISVISYSVYRSFFKNTDVEKKRNVDAIFNDEEDFAFLEYPDDITSENAEPAPQSAPDKTEKSNESVAASSPETVKGKIISKYISPYNAGLSYNNVYVKNSTTLSIDIKSLLAKDLSFKIKKSSDPQVLILHTHATETFMSKDTDYYTEDYTSRSTDNEKNMVMVGKIVSDKLNAAGIKTIHTAEKHDYPSYTGSYTRAAKTINTYLKKYPSIKIVLDLHRDAVSSGESDKVKLVTEIDGKKAAQVMIVMGSQSGGVTNFPDWQENLKLALRLQQTIEVKYPTLARPLSLMSKNYNESLTKGSMLIEFGTDANTLDEAAYSAQLVGDSIVSLLNTLS